MHERWEIIERLGEGGQGTVDLARDTTKVESQEILRDRIILAFRNLSASGDPHGRKGKEAEKLIDTIASIQSRDQPSNLGALKVLHSSEKARDPVSAEERIKREMEVMSRFEHTSLLKILDLSVDERWFVSEYHTGGTLEKRQSSFVGDVKASLTVMRPIVAGVAELHKANVVHRDIKPMNIYFSSDNRPVVGDFGLVYFADNTHTRVSETLENVGSWDWMPVWAQGIRIEEIRPTFDVFSLGKMLWWMVSGLPIQQLRLWYFDKEDKEELNVEWRFPALPHIQLVNPLLAKCVVEDRSDCLPDATALLKEIDNSLAIIENDANLIGPGIARTCKACGLGTYEVVSDENTEHCVGVNRVGTREVRVERCSRCGHAEVFVANEADLDREGFLWHKKR